MTLPRQPGDKPQECSLAVNPRDPRNVIVSLGRDHFLEPDQHNPRVWGNWHLNANRRVKYGRNLHCNGHSDERLTIPLGHRQSQRDLILKI